MLPEEQTALKKPISTSEESPRNTSEVTDGAPRRWILEELGLVKNNKIQISLFADFITTMKQSSNLPAGRQGQTITFDSVANEIKKGEVIISDILTSSEFRLLKFLLENPDKIIEREEIIKSVWSDAKSTEGVTDQALDQLIFRLRKKIEEDPNNPVYLQTVKGRGFRLHSI